MANRNLENKVVVNLPPEAIAKLRAIGNRERVPSLPSTRQADALRNVMTDEDCNERRILPSQTDLIRSVGAQVCQELKALRQDPETRSKHNMTEATLTEWAARRGAELVLGLLNPETSMEGEV